MDTTNKDLSLTTLVRRFEFTDCFARCQGMINQHIRENLLSMLIGYDLRNSKINISIVTAPEGDIVVSTISVEIAR